MRHAFERAEAEREFKVERAAIKALFASRPIDFVHANGDQLCEACSEPYRRHPYTDDRAIDGTGREYGFLHRLCNGKVVKL